LWKYRCEGTKTGGLVSHSFGGVTDVTSIQ